jgi:UDP-2,3-diacylglucosamine hydrolase
VPEIRAFDAPGHWRAIDFLSDLHLDAAHPRTFEAWREQLLGTAADAVFLLGDIFEVWVGDDARHQGFEARCAEVLREAGGRRFIGFMAGNRDFLVGEALLTETGVQRLHDPTLLRAFGHSALLTHGDALCLADVDYQRFRAMVREPAWQQAFLQQPLAQRQAIARRMRDASEAGKRGQAMSDWADVDVGAASQWLAQAGAPALVHGHTHRPGSQAWPGGLVRHVLSDWDLDAPSPRAEVLRLDAGGFSRLAPSQALA